MNSNHYSSQIKNLSHLLSRVHRSLMDFQKKVHEGLDEKKLSVYDTLHLALNHPDFEWLRKISALMAQMDEAVDDKKNPVTEESLKSFSRELREIFIDDSKHTDFKNRLKIALAQDPTLHLEVAGLRAALEKSR